MSKRKNKKNRMKVLAFILSAYLVFLFAIPCCTFDNCPEDKLESAINHEQDDEDCGSCSPFFTCTGCSGFTVLFQIANLEIVPAFSGQRYAGYILSLIPDVHYDFWQPPKLV
jgi:hypothetical protein